jgi:GxxExxY protein
MTVNDRQSLDALAEIAIGAAYEVANTLGCGFIEKVYERALARELMLRGISVETQAPIIVRYKGESVGAYRADILIDGWLIIELKCADQFANEHLAQTLNYLKATGLRLALMINFQRPKVEWRRVVHNF